MDAFWEWFRWLYEETGINFSVFYDPYHRNAFYNGFWMTILISASCLGISVVIGLVGAWLQGSRIRLVRYLTASYIQVFRNTPSLTQLYMFYFGIGPLMPLIDDGRGNMVPMMGSFAWATIAISIHYGAFMIEVFRSGIEAVPNTTTEAARALGMSKFQIAVLVVLPLAFRICLPALNNTFILLVKATTIAYAIGVPEMFYVANQIYAADANVTEMMNLMLFSYVFIISLLVWLMHKWEKKLRVPGFGLAT
jgi:polar amino acid transport system permease protein